MLNILIADDHEIVREGIKQILLEEFVYVNILEAFDAPSAIRFCDEKTVDFIISDLSMPGGGAFSILEAIKSKFLSLPVLILSIYPEEQYALRVLQAGASGYLNKDAAGEELIKAIRQIMNGKKYISEAIAEKFYNKPGIKEKQRLHEALSERELTVFTLLASGISVADIAAVLSMSADSVTSCRSHILEKMNMQSDGELINYAIANKLI